MKRFTQLVYVGLLWGLTILSPCWALEKITPEALDALLTEHSTYMMQKEPEALLNLFSARYQQKNLAHDKILTKAELTKIYKNNLMIAKLIISKIDLLDSHISENGQHAQIKLHLFSRYLLEFEGRQNILTQEEDWLSDVGLENGKLVYLHTEQTAAAKH